MSRIECCCERSGGSASVFFRLRTMFMLPSAPRARSDNIYATIARATRRRRGGAGANKARARARDVSDTLNSFIY